jgi:hypothetical protein
MPCFAIKSKETTLTMGAAFSENKAVCAEEQLFLLVHGEFLSDLITK